MGAFFDEISDSLIAWIKEQHISFVATAPLYTLLPRGTLLTRIHIKEPVGACKCEPKGPERYIQSYRQEHCHVSSEPIISVYLWLLFFSEKWSQIRRHLGP